MSMYCCYKDCPNQHKSFSSKPFFNLPNDSRRELWIKNSGNENADIDWNRRKMFCEDHFDPKDLRKQFTRTLLRRDAVPYVYSADSQVECIEMAESEEEDGEEEASHQSESIELNKPKKSNVPVKMEKYNPTEWNPKTDDDDDDDDDDGDGNEDVALVTPDLTTNATTAPPTETRPKRVASVQQNIALRIIPSKRSREAIEKSEKQIVIDKPSPPIVVKQESTSEITPPTQPAANNINADLMVSSTEKIDSHNEETYFALSLVGILKRLPPHKRAIAKCHILSYLTELEYGSSELPN